MIRRAWRLFRESETIWQWVSEVVTRRPWHVMGLALVVLLPPLLALPAMTLSHDELEQLPADAESAQGFEAIGEHIPPGELAPTLLIIEDDDTAIWDPEAMEALAQLSRNLKRMGGIASVRSVAMPTNGRVPDMAAMAGGGEAQGQQITDMTEGLEQAANGAARIEDGVERLRDGLRQIATRLPELVSGLEEGADGAERLRAGIAEAVDGVAKLRDGLAQLRDGLRQLRSGMVEARDGTLKLKSEVAEPTERSLKEAVADLQAMTVGKTDPMYEQTYRDVGEAYARVTGEYPPGHERAGQQIREDYEGLPEALQRLADGLDEMIAGTEKLDEGLGEFDGGLAELQNGLQRAVDGLGRMADGLDRAVDGVGRLQTGIEEMLTGVDDRLLPGVGRLADGLEAGVAQLQSSDFAALLPGGGEDEEFVIPAALPDTLPRVKEQLSFFVGDDGTRTRIFVGTQSEPFAPEAINAVPEMVRIAELSLNDSPLEDARILPTGTSAFFENVEDVSNRDFKIIVVAVVIGVYLVMALLLRALVAPLYMIATVLLSWATSLGLTVIWFEGIVDKPIAWFVPSFLFVLLVALGADYNIFLMSRVREEASHRPTPAAVATGVRLTGGVITSAGLILAGTFAAMVFTDVASLEQTGFAVAVGVLLDTFIVRSFLVPSIAVIVGRHNWWPSKRARAVNEPAT